MQHRLSALQLVNGCAGGVSTAAIMPEAGRQPAAYGWRALLSRRGVLDWRSKSLQCQCVLSRV